MTNKKNRLAEAVDSTYAVVSKQVIPTAITSVYTFATGVALATSLAAASSKFLAYFSLQYLLAYTSPVAILTGLIFMYFQYSYDKKNKKRYKKLETKIEAYSKQNTAIQHQLAVYFSLHKEEQAQASMEAGKMLWAKPRFRDKRSYLQYGLDFARHFIKDAGLTFGVIAFILTTFTPIAFAGLALTYTIAGSMLLACFTYFFVHRRQYRFEIDLKVQEAELKRQEHLNNWYQQTFETYTSDIPPSNDDTEITNTIWYNQEKLNEGCQKAMLDKLRQAINFYLIDTGCIKKDENYSILEGYPSDLGDKLFKRINKHIGIRSKNTLRAVKLAFMIEYFKNDSEQYQAVLHTFNVERKKARSKSPWSLFKYGHSRLAEELDKTFEEANEDALALVDACAPFDKNIYDNFEKMFSKKLQGHHDLIKHNETLLFPTAGKKTEEHQQVGFAKLQG